jgi:hypothetical protein
MLRTLARNLRDGTLGDLPGPGVNEEDEDDDEIDRHKVAVVIKLE